MALATKPGSRFLLAGIGLSSTAHVAGRYAAWLERQDTLCPVARYIGWQCPFCGGTRSLLYLISGNLHMALDRNFGVVAGVVVGVLAGLWFDYRQGNVAGRKVLGWLFCDGNQLAVERRGRHRH